MKYGLSKTDLELIVKYFNNKREIEKAVLFGSRAKGNFKQGSDIDIALFGEKITFDTITSINYYLNEESPMIYFFDILDYKSIESKELKDHIDRVGIEIYNKNKELILT
ncbi:MAG TPA: nucleotidyltransferase domain-containing protein [Leptospiraceae bacterium]|nr:nucleotidyltransferase domain-containing protein [Leptospiraceae bacterium]HMW03486.1 nucleotidyltransferase domain-containing protein [Leptospiraceae bacterium]HMX34721.1 nucleotidyltransferase domain-containing protein [Leptospiraceae bacterium]HMY29594.1 nucleotidyltransferase domain-containing protein [Leptospiraceae bacterium]HMZ62916.1 nucleotidyltransferase domain-containing protein [Leptospiraceae bacterium]